MDYQIYYRILDLKETAGLAEVKEAYRKMAKKWHPDISSLPDAENHFIEATEAYEVLLRKLMNSSAGLEEKVDSTLVSDWEDQRREWIRQQMEKIRSIAREQARMKYEEFKKTPTYRNTKRLSRGSDYLIFILGFIFISSAFAGIYGQYKHKELDASNIFACFCVTVIGLTIIFYSSHQIKKHKEANL